MIGTEILVNEKAKPVNQELSTGPTSVYDMNRGNRSQIKRANTTPFMSKVKYVLTNIRPVNNSFEYRFSADDGKEYTIEFRSTIEADECIAHALNEPLPDYNDFHARKSF